MEQNTRVSTRYWMLYVTLVALVIGSLLSINMDNWGVLVLVLGIGVTLAAAITNPEDL